SSGARSCSATHHGCTNPSCPAAMTSLVGGRRRSSGPGSGTTSTRSRSICAAFVIASAYPCPTGAASGSTCPSQLSSSDAYADHWLESSRPSRTDGAMSRPIASCRIRRSMRSCSFSSMGPVMSSTRHLSMNSAENPTMLGTATASAFSSASGAATTRARPSSHFFGLGPAPSLGYSRTMLCAVRDRAVARACARVRMSSVAMARTAAAAESARPGAAGAPGPGRVLDHALAEHVSARGDLLLVVADGAVQHPPYPVALLAGDPRQEVPADDLQVDRGLHGQRPQVGAERRPHDLFALGQFLAVALDAPLQAPDEPGLLVDGVVDLRDAPVDAPQVAVAQGVHDGPVRDSFVRSDGRCRQRLIGLREQSHG